MSTPAHLWLEDENGSPIVGGCLMPLRAGSIWDGRQLGTAASGIRLYGIV